MKQNKKRKAIQKKLDRTENYSIEEAIKLVQELKYANFDETVDVAINLGVDPRHADQNIRVSASLPYGTGKTVRVLVLTAGPKEKEAQEAGADYVGGKEYFDKIKAGWTEVDKIVATPDMMSEVGKLGRILGPRGLMPNPKSGTVTMEVAEAVKELKTGKIELRVDKTGIIHAPCGRTSFDATELVENIRTIYETVIKAKPSSVKGQYFKKMTISSTMGPGIKVDLATI